MFTEGELLALIECIDCFRYEGGQYINIGSVYDKHLIDAKDLLIKIKDMGKQLNSSKVIGDANSSIEDCY